MAERYAVATGNWSAVGTWDGGASLPTTGDTVHANTYTVTIDQDVTVGSIRTDAGATAVAGGTFTTSGSRTINADVVVGSSTCLTFSDGDVVNGDSIGGNASTFKYGISGQGIHNGDSYGGSTSNARGTSISGAGTHNGNSTAGSFSGAHGTVITAGSTQNGNSIGGATASAYGTNVTSTAFQNGNSTGGSVSNSFGTNLSAGCVQNGDATGGSTGGIGTVCSVGSIFNGAATGGDASGCHGVELTGNALAKITTATGTTSGAYGVQATAGTNYSVVVIDSESGSYPKNLDATVDTTTDNMPLFAAAAGGAIVNQGLHSIGSGINA